jgi:hypothetical protein
MARGEYGLQGAPKMTIFHQGLTLFPLTPEVLAARPDFDPWRYDALIFQRYGAGGPGWIDFEGKRRAVPLIRNVYRRGDAFYYWDAMGDALAGSRGIAIVRDGRVVETFGIAIS